MKYVFKVNGVPQVSLNALYKGIHWSERKKYKDEWREAFCGWHFWKNERGQLDARTPVRFTTPVHIVYVFKQKYPMDSSNLAFMVKLIEDSLATDKVIEEDSIKCVLSTWMIPVRSDENSVTVTMYTEDEPTPRYSELLEGPTD